MQFAKTKSAITQTAKPTNANTHIANTSCSNTTHATTTSVFADSDSACSVLACFLHALGLVNLVLSLGEAWRLAGAGGAATGVSTLKKKSKTPISCASCVMQNLRPHTRHCLAADAGGARRCCLCCGAARAFPFVRNTRALGRASHPPYP